MLRPYITISANRLVFPFAPPGLATGRRCARSPFDLPDVVNPLNRPWAARAPAASPYRRGCRDFRPTAAQGGRSRDHGPVRVAQDDACAHADRLSQRRAATRTASRIEQQPSHWVATTMAMDMRSAGNAGHGPSSSFRHVAAQSGRCGAPDRVDDELRAFERAHAEALEREQVDRRSSPRRRRSLSPRPSRRRVR